MSTLTPQQRYQSLRDYEQLQADARLGRMIRKMSVGLELSPGPHGSWWVGGDGPYHTPEQALESAGITDHEH